MEILGHLLDALTPRNLVPACPGMAPGGAPGTVIGAPPGLSATMAVAVPAPFTFPMDPAAGLTALGAICTGAIDARAYAAILVNTPVAPSTIATTFDGFAMARRDDGGLAIPLRSWWNVARSPVIGAVIGILPGMFFERTISIGIIIVALIALIALIFPIRAEARTKRRRGGALSATMLIADHDPTPLRTRALRAAIGPGICAGFRWLMTDVPLLRMPVGLLFRTGRTNDQTAQDRRHRRRRDRRGRGGGGA